MNLQLHGDLLWFEAQEGGKEERKRGKACHENSDDLPRFEAEVLTAVKVCYEAGSSLRRLKKFLFPHLAISRYFLFLFDYLGKCGLSNKSLVSIPPFPLQLVTTLLHSLQTEGVPVQSSPKQLP